MEISRGTVPEVAPLAKYLIGLCFGMGSEKSDKLQQYKNITIHKKFGSSFLMQCLRLTGKVDFRLNLLGVWGENDQLASKLIILSSVDYLNFDSHWHFRTGVKGEAIGMAASQFKEI